MADDVDNSLIAALLAAALIAKLPGNERPVAEAVKLYNDVLAELAKLALMVEPPLDTAEPPIDIFYKSSNGDVWCVVQHPTSGEGVVMHRPNESSGGAKSYQGIDQFLEEKPIGPQHAALMQKIERST